LGAKSLGFHEAPKPNKQHTSIATPEDTERAADTDGHEVLRLRGGGPKKVPTNAKAKTVQVKTPEKPPSRKEVLEERTLSHEDVVAQMGGKSPDLTKLTIPTLAWFCHTMGVPLKGTYNVGKSRFTAIDKERAIKDIQEFLQSFPDADTTVAAYIAYLEQEEDESDEEGSGHDGDEHGDDPKPDGDGADNPSSSKDAGGSKHSKDGGGATNTKGSDAKPTDAKPADAKGGKKHHDDGEPTTADNGYTLCCRSASCARSFASQPCGRI
jgi:hypothetical protein